MRRMALLSFLLFLPAAAFAVQINEIMYDLPGSDSGREWIEVYQDGMDCINIGDWKLFEADTNHKITLFSGSPAVCSGGYAILADNAEKFLADNPSFNGNLFDSAFSLSNTGETLELKDRDGNVADSVSYSGSWGAGGNGRTLERNANGWLESLVNGTPGAANSIKTGVQETMRNITSSSQQNILQSNYSPLIDFAIIGRSNHVEQESTVEIAVSVSSNYLINRSVGLCTYITSGDAVASNVDCTNVTLPPDGATELRFHNILSPEYSGNLTVIAELTEGIAVKKETAFLEVKPTEIASINENPVTSLTVSPSGAFAAETSDPIYEFLLWLRSLLPF